MLKKNSDLLSNGNQVRTSSVFKLSVYVRTKKNNSTPSQVRTERTPSCKKVKKHSSSAVERKRLLRP